MKIRITGIYSIIFIMTLIGCTNNVKPSKKDDLNIQKPDSVFIPKYANRFKIKYFKNHKFIEVIHPWDTLAPVLTNTLSSDTTFLNKKLDAVKIPVKKWVAVASTQVSYANKINVLNELVGMAEPEYVSNEIVRKGLKNGRIKNIGTAFAPDVEKLMLLQPDMMMISPFKDDFYGPVREAGINLAVNCSYLENTPLGRVEWLVYVAAFFNKEKEAIEIVNDIAIKYKNIKKLARKAKEKPTVISGKLYQGVWYVAAAESYNANFLKDANVKYLYDDRHGTGSLNYDFEAVYSRGGEADFWMMMVNYNGEFSYSLLKSQDDRYSDFKAFKNKNIVYSNTHYSMLYEKGLLEPDEVLADYVHAFHPDLLQDREPVYFKKLYKN